MKKINIVKVQGTQFFKDETGWIFAEGCGGISSGFNEPRELLLLEILQTLKKIERKIK